MTALHFAKPAVPRGTATGEDSRRSLWREGVDDYRSSSDIDRDGAQQEEGKLLERPVSYCHRKKLESYWAVGIARAFGVNRRTGCKAKLAEAPASA